MLGIGFAVAHALENHRRLFPDAVWWAERFMLERLAGTPVVRRADAKAPDTPGGGELLRLLALQR
ncbi:hypothetical protein MOKP4_28470 [Mycobacterium avium subsp. hominissuis]|uniref:Uncharacterized protein n=1 Tax=Mycobacterium avium subsp. hominissuis TaxID=439334 RepID=A0AAI8X2C5_MYCAV|nr:hypothetical protein MAH_1640 [Mycobacterium avium subsp. hominissuis TH135]BBN47627.1 hypothetical protein JPH1_21020 [Mycobacterium avium subsp. hominissuis]